MPDYQDLFSKRDYVESKVKEMILGPGYARELFACDDVEHEILDDNPTRLYASGVMVPSGPSEEDDSDSGFDVDESVFEEDADDEWMTDDDSEGNEADGNGREEPIDDDRDDRDNRSSTIGLIACVAPDTNKIELEVTYAKYSKLASSDLGRVKLLAGDHYDVLKLFIQRNDGSDAVANYLRNKGIGIPFSSCFTFDDTARTVSLRIPFDAQILRVINKPIDWDRESTAQAMLRKLLRGQFYERHPFFIEKKLIVDSLSEDTFKLDDNLDCYLKSYVSGNGKKYVKVLVKNILPQSDHGLDYKDCLFQSTVKLIPVGSRLLTFTDPISSPMDLENSVNEFIYRSIVNFGKGIGCAAVWDSDGRWIQSSYMPRAEVKKFSNSFEKDADGSVPYKEISTLRNISIWTTYGDDALLNGLKEFVDGYGKWHSREIESAGDDMKLFSEEVKYILTRQQSLLERMQENVAFMRNNPEALTCFKIANTAMLIQMVISRDGNFKKNRKDALEDKDIFDSLDYFREARYIKGAGGTMEEEPCFRPFQLAFLLMNVKSTLVEDDVYRKKFVDLIWFPTGGGKTEAYLALTALTIVARRRNSMDVISGFDGDRPSTYSNGVSVIMRYTLRLLTSQQFERASFLICALDFLREKDKNLKLGDERISIGLWIGKGSSPNSINELTQGDTKYRKYLHGDIPNNPFPVAYCPWCGTQLYDSMEHNGYNADGYLSCLNDSCCFRTDKKLPIHYIDSVVYEERPTLLFATVDKFAQLWKDDAAGLIRTNGIKSPDLIIQDELHLISGPLGSTVSLFEGIVEEMASKDGHRPKIIASTATTRNTGSLIKNLYGKDREVSIFPAQGISYKNNYFSHLEEESLRCHIGVIPTGRANSNITEINLTSILLLCRLGIAKMISEGSSVYDDITDDGVLVDSLDLFWSLVLYYNSLKDLGRSSSRASQEIVEKVRSFATYFQVPLSLSFLKDGLDRRKREFTSREDSLRIKKILTEAESHTRLGRNDSGDRVRVDSSAVDLVYASNMISVGIDIARWNLMIMVGQPRSTAEYIQSSSRAARSYPGLIINLINPNRNREFSLFENYTSFHSAYYKYVEPLSVTPINDQMLELPLWVNMWRCYKNYLYDSNRPNDSLSIVDSFLSVLNDRYEMDEWMKEDVRDRLSDLSTTDCQEEVMDSLREIAKDCYIMIKEIEY